MYRTTSRITTSETSYSLTYGTEVVIPIKVWILSCVTIVDNLEGNEEGLTLKKDILDEKRKKSSMWLVAYQHQVANYYNWLVKPRQF